MIKVNSVKTSNKTSNSVKHLLPNDTKVITKKKPKI